MSHSIDMGWYVMSKYYGLSEKSPVYAAAILLNPSKRKAYIEAAWIEAWIQPAVDSVEKLWRERYKSLQDDQPVSNPTYPISTGEPTLFEKLEQRLDVIRRDAGDIVHDDLLHFINDTPFDMGNDSKGNKLHPLEWWTHADQRRRYPRLSRMAMDVFSIPPMSDEPERVFSSARRTISWFRHSLSARMVEILECFNHWIRNGLLRLSNGMFDAEDLIDDRDMDIDTSWQLADAEDDNDGDLGAGADAYIEID